MAYLIWAISGFRSRVLQKPFQTKMCATSVVACAFFPASRAAAVCVRFYPCMSGIPSVFLGGPRGAVCCNGAILSYTRPSLFRKGPRGAAASVPSFRTRRVFFGRFLYVRRACYDKKRHFFVKLFFKIWGSLAQRRRNILFFLAILVFQSHLLGYVILI